MLAIVSIAPESVLRLALTRILFSRGYHSLPFPMVSYGRPDLRLTFRRYVLICSHPFVFGTRAAPSKATTSTQTVPSGHSLSSPFCDNT